MGLTPEWISTIDWGIYDGPPSLDHYYSGYAEREMISPDGRYLLVVYRIGIYDHGFPISDNSYKFWIVVFDILHDREQATLCFRYPLPYVYGSIITYDYGWSDDFKKIVILWYLMYSDPDNPGESIYFNHYLTFDVNYSVDDPGSTTYTMNEQIVEYHTVDPGADPNPTSIAVSKDGHYAFGQFWTGMPSTDDKLYDLSITDWLNHPVWVITHPYHGWDSPIWYPTHRGFYQNIPSNSTSSKLFLSSQYYESVPDPTAVILEVINVATGTLISSHTAASLTASIVVDDQDGDYPCAFSASPNGDRYVAVCKTDSNFYGTRMICFDATTGNIIGCSEDIGNLFGTTTSNYSWTTEGNHTVLIVNNSSMDYDIWVFNISDGQPNWSGGTPVDGFMKLQTVKKHSAVSSINPYIGAYLDALCVSTEGSNYYCIVEWVPVAPAASFSGTPLTANVPFTVTFTDASTETPTSWAWQFGDGGTSTTQNPTHDYTVAGTYTVALTATNGIGSGFFSRVGYITASPMVSASSWGNLAGSTRGTALVSSSSGTTHTRIYLGLTGGANGLICMNTAGTVQWSAATGKNIITAPAIDPNHNIITCATDGTVYSFKYDGTTNWSVATGVDLSYVQPVTDGTTGIYINTGSIKKYNLSGTLQWTSAASGFYGTPAVSSDGYIYAVCNTDSKLYKMRQSDGGTEWASSVYSTGAVKVSPLVAGSWVYAPSGDGGFTAFRPSDGVQIWGPSWSGYSGGTNYQGMVDNAGHTAAYYIIPGYDGSHPSILVAMDTAAYTQLWYKNCSSQSVGGEPLIDSSGNVYVGEAVTASRLTKYNSAGTVQWTTTTDVIATFLNSHMCMSADESTIYSVWAGRVYSINTSTGAATLIYTPGAGTGYSVTIDYY